MRLGPFVPILSVEDGGNKVGPFPILSEEFVEIDVMSVFFFFLLLVLKLITDVFDLI